MGLFGKIANIATGGALGMAKGIAKGDPKAVLSGGMLGSKRPPMGGPGGPAGGFVPPWMQKGAPGPMGEMLRNRFPGQGGPMGGPMGEMPQGQGPGGWAAGAMQQMPQMMQMAQQAQPQFVAPGEDYAQRGGVAPQMQQGGFMPPPGQPEQKPQAQDYETLKAQYGAGRAREMMQGQ